MQMLLQGSLLIINEEKKVIIEYFHFGQILLWFPAFKGSQIGPVAWMMIMSKVGWKYYQ